MAKVSVLLVCSVLYGCSEGDPDGSNLGHVEQIVFSELDSGFFSLSASLDIRKQLLTINNQDDLDRVWGLYSESPATIDFEEHLVLALQMGTQDTGGYSIEVDHIDEFKRFLRVEVISLFPGENCITAQSETDPYQFVTIPNTGKQVTFSENVNIVDCD